VTAAQPSVRVVIAQRSGLLRAATIRLLRDAGIEVAAEAADAAELLRKVRAHRPDVAILDLRSPAAPCDDTLRALAAIRSASPAVGVLLLSERLCVRYATELLERGAEGTGYLLEARVLDVARFIEAVRQVAARGTVLDPEILTRVLARNRREEHAIDALDDRGRAVLEQMAAGVTNRAIAERMFLSERAVERHVTSIFDTFGLPSSRRANRRVLAVLAYRSASPDVA
jgi:DNA-binding NarL/FixJ family response regulator